MSFTYLGESSTPQSTVLKEWLMEILLYIKQKESKKVGELLFEGCDNYQNNYKTHEASTRLENFAKNFNLGQAAFSNEAFHIFQEYEANVWACVVLKVIDESDPPFIPPQAQNELFTMNIETASDSSIRQALLYLDSVNLNCLGEILRSMKNSVKKKKLREYSRPIAKVVFQLEEENLDKATLVFVNLVRRSDSLLPEKPKKPNGTRPGLLIKKSSVARFNDTFGPSNLRRRGESDTAMFAGLTVSARKSATFKAGSDFDFSTPQNMVRKNSNRFSIRTNDNDGEESMPALPTSPRPSRGSFLAMTPGDVFTIEPEMPTLPRPTKGKRLPRNELFSEKQIDESEESYPRSQRSSGESEKRRQQLDFHLSGEDTNRRTQIFGGIHIPVDSRPQKILSHVPQEDFKRFNRATAAEQQRILDDIHGVDRSSREDEFTGIMFLNSKKMQKDLENFYTLIDSKSVTVAHLLFKYYNFADIVVGIYNKYQFLPIAWKRPVEEFDILPDVEVHYLTEDVNCLSSWPFYINFFERDNMLEKVVDEFVQSEQIYYQRMKCFVDQYANNVNSIAAGKLGDTAKNSLGLSPNEVQLCFGSHLYMVTKASRKFLRLLESLCICPYPKKEIEFTGGRPGILIDLMSMTIDKLMEYYTPYHVHYKSAAPLLGSRNPRERRRVGGKVDPLGMNYLQIWKEVGRGHNLIRDKTISSVLITPVQRFPQYTIFLQRMEKLAAKTNHISLPSIRALQEQLANRLYALDMKLKDL
eukprot:augustus_masked-scaffold_4-processed-gene-18.3-mRNA-1 protein AED:1.00 eAED:1.00 QI:0/-1/0/0/-1/1/1/0/754